MVLSLAACGSKEPAPSGDNNNPGTSQQGSQNDDSQGNTEKSIEGKKSVSFEWPTADYISEGMKWNGTGKITSVQEKASKDEEGNPYNITRVYLDSFTLDEMSAYIEQLKADGFAYKGWRPGAEEPPIEFKEASGAYSWEGTAEGRYISILGVNRMNTDSHQINGELEKFEYSLYILLSDYSGDKSLF